MSEIIKAPFLVVSHNVYMRGIIKFVLESLLHTDVTELESEEKALNYLKESSANPYMIIYDYTPNAYLLEDFVGHLKNSSKDVKIVVLAEKVTEEARQLLRDVSQLVLMNENDIPHGLVAEASQAFASAGYANDLPYCRIDLRFLSMLDGINKGLYLKLGQDKYVKIFNEDENTEILDLEKYMAKGVQYLYLERAIALWVIDQVQKQINIFLRSNNFRFVLRGTSESPEKKFEQKILRINDEVHIDPEFKKEVMAVVDRIKSVVDKSPDVQKFLARLMSKKEQMAYYTQKINITSLIACALAKQLEWSSKSTIEKLIYAATLCDITLAARPNILSIQNLHHYGKRREEMDDYEQSLFLNHPQEGSSLLKHYFSSAPPETEVLAYQHHELPDGSGFPTGMKAERIAPLSALFIIANDFAYYFMDEEEPSFDEYLLRAQGKFDYVNFRKIVKALEKLK